MTDAPDPGPSAPAAPVRAEHNPIDDGNSILLQEAFEQAYDAPLLDAGGWVWTAGRPALSLDGDWGFTLDLHMTGLRSRWYRMTPMPPEARGFPWDWDPFDTETCPVPSCWQTAMPEARHFEGAAWYVRSFDRADLPDAPRHVLRVGAAAYEAKVFLNGAYLGRHRGASGAFHVELTAHLRDGANHLFLCVDNRRDMVRVPMRHTDWFNYGGLYREVSVVGLPTRAIRDMFVHLVPDGSFGRVRVAATLEGDGPDTARLRIPELGVDAQVPVAAGAVDAVIEVAPELWSPARPRLYDVTLDWGGDAVSDRVGFREIRREGTRLLLNGAPLWLRGISVHEDDAERGKVSTRADLARRMRDAAELGANFMRLAHYPHHEDAARMADEAGLLLWEEIPVYWNIAFEDPGTLADATNQLTELILRDRNRASVILWSVGNENPDTDARFAFMSALADTARALDPSRLVTAACLVNHAEHRIDDRLAEAIDVIGVNEYCGWYRPDFDELARIGANSAPDRPVVISEMGADAVPVAHGGPAKGLFSEAYMAEVYARQIEAIEALDWVQGLSPWLLYDFRSDRRRNRWQAGWNRKGLIAADKRTRKAAFDVLAALYRRKAEAGDIDAEADRD